MKEERRRRRKRERRRKLFLQWLQFFLTEMMTTQTRFFVAF